MEKQEVIEIAVPDFEDLPSDPALKPGGDVSPEEWKRLQRENRE